ncbi:AKL18 protein [Puccinia sorghi]|uniref:AKL18 protein n=1 Tax=Puccinia sorghi TaxID=27349 RepID=A0A0L6VMK1_9BASI|nr:AKL18 protein [Puccinia sorghi]
MARQFMGLFNKTIMTENLAPILKEWERKLRVCANSNHNHNNSYLISKSTPISGHDSSTKTKKTLKIIKPSGGLSQTTFTSFIPSNPAVKILHAFQYFVYFYTHGQMTLANFEGNPPLITNPKVLDLTPRPVFLPLFCSKYILTFYNQKKCNMFSGCRCQNQAIRTHQGP